jgi:hypothetical protein
MLLHEDNYERNSGKPSCGLCSNQKILVEHFVFSHMWFGWTIESLRISGIKFIIRALPLGERRSTELGLFVGDMSA